MTFHRDLPDAAIASYDLHLHTCWSYDATVAVEPHFVRAAELGLRCIAIAEHQNVDSIAEAEECARRFGQVRYIRAVELSVAHGDSVYDVLCYGLPAALPEAVQTALAQHHQQAQSETAAAILKGLARAGIQLSTEEHMRLLAERRPQRVLRKQGLTRLQSSYLAEWLVAQGRLQTKGEYVKLMRTIAMPAYPPAQALIPLFRGIGAIVVLAHPADYFKEFDERRLDELREGLMLDGIECAHSVIPIQQTPVYEAYCIRHRLLCTAGSDCHNPSDLITHFARHGGAEHWLEPFLDRLPH